MKKIDSIRKNYIISFDKIVLLVFLLLCIFLILDKSDHNSKPQVEAANIYANQGWTYRKSITVDNTKVSGSIDFTNFPVLVSFASDAQLAANALANGNDIFFTSDDGETKLDHEIETYNSSTGALVAWVKVPTLKATSDTTIYIYYGNSGASNQENASGVWTNYQSVVHLAEDPSVSTDGDCGGGTKEICDSTANNGDGDSAGSMTNSDSVTGVIGKAINFDGIDDRINFGNINNVTTNDFSISFWLRTIENTTGAHAVAKGANVAATPGYRLYLHPTIGRLGFTITDPLMASTDTTPGSYSPLANDGNWQYATWTFDRNGNATIYINGVAKSSASILAQDGQDLTNTEAYYIGRASQGQYWDGDLDEVRMSNSLISGDQVTTEYNNQNSPATFYSLSSQESLTTFCGDGGVQTPNDDGFTEQCDDGNTNSGDGCTATCLTEGDSSSWFKRKLITINESQITGSTALTDFPVLISIASDTDLVTSAQSDGDDIKFTLSDGTTQLNHEIEYFNSSTGQLQAWVKIPSLSATVDTQIYMYYGNSLASNQQNISGTWNSGYVGVWHLDETTGLAYDSTTLGNNATRNNINAAVTGKIDGADDYNGISGPGSGSYATAALNSSLDFDSSFTLSAWINMDALPSVAGSNSAVISKSIITSGITTSWTLYLSSANDRLSLLVADGTVSSTYSSSSVVVPSIGAWNYYSTSFTEGGVTRLRVNSTTASVGTNVQMTPSASKQLYLGAQNNGYNNLNGVLDEVRISNVARSTDWLQSEYNNQNTPSSFHTIGTEEQITYCGDGTTQATNGQGGTEQCDDAADNGVVCSAGYGASCNYCSTTCQTVNVNGASCGDSNIDSGDGEQCDDGVNNGVECSAAYESTCNYCDNSCQTAVANGATCGDGSTDALDGEECDAGVNNDVVCSADYGSTCDYCDSTCSTITITGATCGDGTTDSGDGEQCDDSNTTNGDGCDSTCQNEVCGNSIVQSGETCDDGNTTPGDGCNATCQLESCGDGVTQTGETCDDAGANGSVCSPAYGSTCDYCNSSCQTVTLTGASCGDSNINSGDGETCDNGVANGNVCSASYGSSCNYCSSLCQTTTVNGASCGDGNIDSGAGETCDDSNTTNGDGCSSTCQTETCGDGVVQSGETCDDSNTSNDDGCSSSCQIESCGDGISQAGEQCDNAGSNGNVCTASYESTCDYCNNSCQVITLNGASCGDGNVNSGNGEACDNGGSNGTVCSATYGNTCNYCNNSCQTISVQGGLCGDGNLDYTNSEQCDDSNTTSGDGCTSSCQYEITNAEVQAYCGPIDVNFDSRITLVDFVNFTGIYGKQCVDSSFSFGCGAKDGNSDQVIGLLDFVQFVSKFNQTTCN